MEGLLRAAFSGSNDSLDHSEPLYSCRLIGVHIFLNVRHTFKCRSVIIFLISIVFHCNSSFLPLRIEGYFKLLL